MNLSKSIFLTALLAVLPLRALALTQPLLSKDIGTNAWYDYVMSTGTAWPKVKLVWGADGTGSDITTLTPLPIRCISGCSGGGGGGTVDQGVQGDPASPWFVLDQSSLAELTTISSQLAGTLTITGSVTVSNFPATQPVSGTVAVSNFPATQPISGTVTANIGTTGGLALDSSLSMINTTLGSPFQVGGSIANTAFGISGTLPAYAATPTFNLGTLGGAATAANQATAQASLTSIDSKLTSPLAVTGTFFQAVQPVSQSGAWSVTANAGTNLNTSSLALSATQTNGAQKTQRVDGSGNISPAGDVATRPVFMELSDGANPYDARQISSVPAVQNKSSSGSLATAGDTVAIDTSGMSTVFIEVTTSAFTGTIVFEGQGTGTSFYQTYGTIPFSTLLGSCTSACYLSVNVGGWTNFRVRALTWSSGSATVKLTSSVGVASIEVHNLTAGNLNAIVVGTASAELAHDASVSGLQVSQGSTTSGQKGELVQGAVTTNQPSYTTAQTNPLSLTLRGGLRAKVIGLDTVTLIRNDYSSVNVTTASYVQLLASTSLEINRLSIFDSSGQDLVLATGGAGSEVDQIQIPPGGWDAPIELYIPSGTRLSVKSKSATASAGILLITGLK